jgi:molybdopterin converting factor small subunit
LADLLDSVGARHGPGLAKLLAGCSYLVDGVARRDLELTVSDDSTVDILPPFAGG